MFRKGVTYCGCSRFRLSEKGHCGTLLNYYAKDGMMNFCYLCGTKMIIEEDIIFCIRCKGAQFDVPQEIQLSSIHYCPLCGRSVRHTRNRVNCHGQCTFRIVVSETQSAMSQLMKYATRRKFTHCYLCGSEANNDTHHVVCSKKNCGSFKFTIRRQRGSYIDGDEPQDVRRKSNNVS